MTQGKPHIYNPLAKSSGTDRRGIRQKHPPEFGDHVALLPYNLKWGIPGTVGRKTQWQTLDRRGYYYNIYLCTGETVAANEYDFCLLPEDWEDWEEPPEPEEDW